MSEMRDWTDERVRALMAQLTGPAFLGDGEGQSTARRTAADALGALLADRTTLEQVASKMTAAKAAAEAERDAAYLALGEVAQERDALRAERDEVREALIDVLLQATIYSDGSASWPCDDMGLSSNEDAVALLVRLGVLEQHPTKRRLFRLAGGGVERVGPDGSRPVGQSVPPDASAATPEPAKTCRHSWSYTQGLAPTCPYCGQSAGL